MYTKYTHDKFQWVFMGMLGLQLNTSANILSNVEGVSQNFIINLV